jgi:glycosyltransferase involved in cell wall biosynthesis
MYKDHRIAVVVPAHNEQALIETTIKSIPDYVEHVIVVDDASTDETYAVAMAVNDPRVEVIRHETNTGVGGAVLSGHRRAADRGADVAVVMAGDGQMDPAHLPELLDAICVHGYDFAKGNRFFAFGSFAGMPRHRIVGSMIIGLLTKAATGYWQIFDPLNGYTAIRTSVLQRIPLDRIRRDYSFEADLLIHLNTVGALALDVPIPARYGSEVSGVRLPRASVSFLSTLFRGFWRRMLWKYMLWSFSPVALFFLSGLALTAWGMGVGIWVALRSIGPEVPTTATVLLAVGPLLVGVNLLVMAALLDVLESRRTPLG